MKIQIDPHTLERAEERGVNEEEIREVLDLGFTVPGKYHRFGKAKIFEFQREWQGKFYQQKRVEVFYTVERDVIITVTVYVFYGIWEA
jgi:hypothetical protein